MPSAERFLDTIHKAVKAAKEGLGEARRRQKEYADKKRSVASFEVGDKVLLNTQNITFKAAGPRKFLPRWVDPFEVVATVGTVAYCLALTANFKIHDVFHVNLLKPYRHNAAHNPPPPTTLVAGEEMYDIESVLDYKPKPTDKRRKSTMRFRFKREGYGHEHNTWEPYNNVKSQSETLQSLGAS